MRRIEEHNELIQLSLQDNTQNIPQGMLRIFNYKTIFEDFIYSNSLNSILESFVIIVHETINNHTGTLQSSMVHL